MNAICLKKGECSRKPRKITHFELKYLMNDPLCFVDREGIWIASPEACSYVVQKPVPEDAA